jgi:two-component system OmpR family sensor kinase
MRYPDGGGLTAHRSRPSRLKLSASLLKLLSFSIEVESQDRRSELPPSSSGGHLVIATSLGDLDNTVTRLEIADAIAAAAVVLLAGVGLPLVRASLAPLREIESTTAAIAGGDLSRRIDHTSGHSEVGRLADALDMMLASIEAAYRARADAT